MGRFTVYFRYFTYNLTHVKVIKALLVTERTLHLKKLSLTQERYCEVGIIIALN